MRGAQVSVNFNNIINVHALNCIRKKEDELIVLNQIKNLKIIKRQRLVKLRSQTQCKIHKIFSKKKELNRLRFLVNHEIKKCKKVMGEKLIISLIIF